MWSFVFFMFCAAFCGWCVGAAMGHRAGTTQTWKRATELLNESTALTILRLRLGIEQPGPEKRKDLPS